MKQTRIYAYDVVRVVAALGVIALHITAESVAAPSILTAENATALVINCIARASVPLFLMLTGALLLNEHKPIPARKPITTALRTYGILMLWSFAYAAVFYIILPGWFPQMATTQLSWRAFVRAGLSGHYHLWYLFMIIGLYLIIPVLRLFIKQENRRIIEYLLVLAIIVKLVLPSIIYLLNVFGAGDSLLSLHYGQFDFSFLGGSVLYALFGWYIANTDFSPKNCAMIHLIGICGVLTTILLSYFLPSELSKGSVFFYSTEAPNILAESAAIFVFLLENCKHPAKEVYRKWMQRLSQMSFGVYLIHPLVLFFVDKVTKNVLQLPNFYCGRVLINFIFVTGISFVLTYLLSQIPLLRKIVVF